MNHRQLLLDNGYVQLPILSKGEAFGIKLACASKLESEGSVEHKDGLTLTMTLPYNDPAILNLIERSRGVLFNLGFSDAIFWSARLINKIPGEVERAWHQDWIPWNEKVSYEEDPPQIGVMVYLQETKKENGALRVLPGAHRNHKTIRDIYSVRATGEMDGEVTVEASVCDLTIVDARLPHATHPNLSENHRAMMTLWFIPNYRKLPETLQEYFSRTQELRTELLYKGNVSNHEIRFSWEEINEGV